jgi:hypothetical protein
MMQKIIIIVGVIGLVVGLGLFVWGMNGEKVGQNQNNQPERDTSQQRSPENNSEQTSNRLEQVENQRQVDRAQALAADNNIGPNTKAQVYTELCNRQVNPMRLEQALMAFFVANDVTDDQIARVYQADPITLELIEDSWGVSVEEFCSVE